MVFDSQRSLCKICKKACAEASARSTLNKSRPLLWLEAGVSALLWTRAIPVLSPSQVDCAQCDVLRRALEDIEHIYAEARGRFSELTQRPDVDTFDKARAWLNEVRLDYESARIGLERHQRIHKP
jgi:hypothetical protein